MSRRTPNQEKALGWYVKQNDLRPKLSAHPIYEFIDKQGKQVKINISSILRQWERMREESNGKRSN